MKKIVFTLFLLSGLFVLESSAQFKFGAGVAVPLEATQIGLQGRALYGISDQMAGSGAFTIYLGDSRSFSIDADFQYKLIEDESYSLAPFAGINYTTIDVSFLGSISNTSLQLGAFFELPLGGFDVFLEPKFILDGSVLVLSGGILF